MDDMHALWIRRDAVAVCAAYRAARHPHPRRSRIDLPNFPVCPTIIMVLTSLLPRRSPTAPTSSGKRKAAPKAANASTGSRPKPSSSPPAPTSNGPPIQPGRGTGIEVRRVGAGLGFLLAIIGRVAASARIVAGLRWCHTWRELRQVYR